VFSDNTIPKDSVSAVEEYRNSLRIKLDKRLSSIRSDHVERHKHLTPPLTKKDSPPPAEEPKDYGVQSDYVDQRRGYVELSDSEDSYDDDFESEIDQLAGMLASMPTRGFGLTKKALNATYANDLRTQLDLEEELQTEAGQTYDFREGVNAFLEKRKPAFKGE
jgi:hypothetical protein